MAIRTPINRKIARNVIADSIIVTVFLFGFAVITMFGFHIFTETTADIDTSVMSVEAQEVLTDMETGYPDWFNGGFVFALFLLWIMVIAASLAIRSHPLFFIIMIIILAFVVVLGAVLSNAFEDITTDADFQDTADHFVPINFIMNNFAAVVMVMGFSIGVSLFAQSYFG